MAIELKKVQNIETLALGFNYEASIDLSTLGTTAGSATAVDIQVGGAAMAGGIFGAAIIVDELVVGTSITDATIAIGDDGDADGFVDEVDVFNDSGNLGKIFANTGALSVVGFHLVSAVDLTYNFTGEGPDVATEGKIRLLMKYYPTAGELFAS
tara:strand:+ start:6608 stop:7069 length:462 start_codon:yes stop_codon:yes gene_type:complete